MGLAIRRSIVEAATDDYRPHRTLILARPSSSCCQCRPEALAVEMGSLAPYVLAELDQGPIEPGSLLPLICKAKE
jgi:hypothetical protein